MVPFEFGRLWVGHDSTFEIDIVPFLNNCDIGYTTYFTQTFTRTLISDGFSVLPRVSLRRGLSGDQVIK